MKSQNSTCSSPEFQQALQENEQSKIVQCLFQCFNGFKHHFFKKGISSEDMHEIFWEATFSFIKRNTAGTLSIRTGICIYFRGFFPILIKAFFRKKGKYQQVEFQEATIQDYTDDSTFLRALLIREEEEKVKALYAAIQKLNPGYQQVIKGFALGKKDREIAEDLQLNNPGAIAVMRKRSFIQLRQILETDYPELF